MRLGELLPVLRSIAPESLAEPWDKVGLHLGRDKAEIRRALLCIDLTHAVLTEARRSRCELIVAYHPPIFQPLAKLTEATWKDRLLLDAAEAGIAIYSPHTALDAVRGGITDALCTALGEGQTVPISPRLPQRNEYKIITFVPEAHAARVRAALAAAGAGGIGNYRECSFEHPGTGGFRPVKGAKPTIGQIGKRETLTETRMEMLCPAQNLAEALAALRANHPYEEPAFDLLRLEVEPLPAAKAPGAGRILTLDKPVSLAILAQRFRKATGTRHLQVAKPAKAKPIHTVAVCPGSGGSLFEKAPLCDAFVTGEMQHHLGLDLRERGAAVLLAGHTQTERPFLRHYARRLQKTGAPMEWMISKADRPALAIA